MSENAKKINRQNVTLSIPKSILKEAKALAAKRELSLSRFLIEALEEKIKRDTGYEKAMLRQIKLLEKGLDLGTSGEKTWSREELHERN